ncbi:hypothetical protein Q9189_002468 [Teloschistes chrysophthalmus]
MACESSGSRLARISRLLQDTAIPWRAVHVAGTNGKGSVCAYVSAMLHAANIKTGRFTSPHLIDRWDCITIAERTVDKSLFCEVEETVRNRDSNAHDKASEFEILTATAFEVLARAGVDIGVIEVGLGGQEDATNIIEDPLVTVVTKIGKDHQSILGDTVEAIARHKAGIFKHTVPCVVDSTSQEAALQVLRRTAQEVGAGPLLQVPLDHGHGNPTLEALLRDRDMEPHQRIHVLLAYHAAWLAVQQTAPMTQPSALLAGVDQVCWPGRLQNVDLTTLAGRAEPVILDGAHNPQSAEVLASYVNKKVRLRHRPVTWMIGVSAGKNIRELLSFLVQHHDNIAAVEFGPVDGMPWVSSAQAASILDEARSLGVVGSMKNAGPNVIDAIKWAAKTAAGEPMVIAGSLYLVSDVLRLLRKRKAE